MFSGNIFDTSYIAAWASGVYQEVNNPSNIGGAVYISGWVIQDDQLGQLNAALGTSFSGVSGFAVSPGLYPEELAVLSAQFKVQWYMREFGRSLSVDSTLIGWQNFREGDRSVSRPNAATVGQTFLQAKKDATEEYNRLVVWYRNQVAGANRPSSLDFRDFTAPRPTFGVYNRM